MRSAAGGEYWCASRRIDGTAITTRISTGTKVQTTSSVVLWLVRDGVGWAPRRKRITTQPSRPSTKSEMIVISGIRMTVVEPGRFLADRRHLILHAHAAVGLADAGRRRGLRRRRGRGGIARRGAASLAVTGRGAGVAAGAATFAVGDVAPSGACAAARVGARPIAAAMASVLKNLFIKSPVRRPRPRGKPDSRARGGATRRL